METGRICRARRTARARIVGAAGAMIVVACAIGPAAGQQYPAKAVRLVIPIAPGGTTDILGRVLGQELTRNLGQQFIIENRPGASGIIGTEAVARSPGDGYTLLLTTSTHTINPSLYRKLPYESLSDFTPISLMASSPMVLVVNPSLPARNVQELITLAKKSDGALNYGSAGAGTPSHLVVELFSSSADIRMGHIPYRGGGPSLTDVISGQIQLKFSAIVPAIPMISAGKVRALGVTSPARVGMLPDVPTIAEAGVPSFEYGLWYAMLGPARMNATTVNLLSEEVRKALTTANVKSRIESEGGEVIGGSSQRLGEHMRKEIDRFQVLIRAAGMKPSEL